MSPRGSRHTSLPPVDGVARIEASRAAPAGQNPARLLVAIVDVTCRAGSDPGRELVCDGAIVGALAVVPEPLRNRTPARAVTNPRSGQGVSDLVQEDLMDFVVFVAPGEVPRDGDSVLVEAAQASPGLGIVEAERPHGGVEMEGDERLRPSSHPV